MDARCALCGRRGITSLSGGLPGAGGLAELPVCSVACREDALRLAGRYLANRGPAIAGHVVAAVGVLAGLLFTALDHELGGVLLVVSVFALGTTRLAYPELVPAPLVRRLGAHRALEGFQWLGVAACATAAAISLFALVRWLLGG